MTATEQDPRTRWLSDDEQAVWRLFLDMKNRLDAQLAREMQDGSGLSMPDFAVLAMVSENAENRLRILELARSLQWEKSRLSHQLSRMEQRGLITRETCDDDRRGSFVAITDAGRAAVEATAPRHVESVRRYLFDVLTGPQLEQLGAIARAVVTRLDAQGDGAGDCCPDARADCG